MLRLLLFLLPIIALAQEPFPGLTFHQAPKPLAKNATFSEWPRFFGPHDNCTTNEAPLLKDLSSGLTPIFELTRGHSYASPIIAKGKLLHFHSTKDHEVLDCLHPETGQRFWTFSYPFKYKDRYGFAAGPRTSPLIKDEKIYLIGVTAMLHCLDLNTGKILWKRDLKTELKIPQYFFGYGPNPVLYKDKLILNTGGKENGDTGTSVIALNVKTGETLWKHQDAWGASYASPIITTLHNQDVIALIAAGESRPTHGGLLILDPDSGKLHSRFPWRATVYESVLASSPISLPGNKIFISDCYEKGGVLLQFDKNLQPKVIWQERWFGMHMVIPQLINDHLYGFAGRNIPDTELKAVNLTTGKIVWKNDMRWEENGRVTGLFRGSFIKTKNRLFSLGEDGSFLELSLTPSGPETIHRTRLFLARETWTPPVIHRGLLYITQNTNGFDGSKRRLICYDLRAQEDTKTDPSK